MALKPSYEEMRDFKKFLEGKGFKANDCLVPDVFYLYLPYGSIFVRIDYTKKNEFKSITAKLSLDWNDGPYCKSKFPQCLDLGKPVKSLDRNFIEHCIGAANSVMEEIDAIINRIPALLDRHLANS
jgi:hypothetical protein